MRWLKLEATCTARFVTANTYYISQGIGVRKVQNSKK